MLPRPEHLGVLNALVKLADALSLWCPQLASDLDLLDEPCNEEAGPKATTMLLFQLDLMLQ